MADNLTNRRIAEAIYAMHDMTGDLPPGVDKAQAIEMTIQAIDTKDPEVLFVVEMVQRCVSAYYGVSADVELEVSVRAVIEMVANGNKAKAFELPILEGEGTGRWEMIVRRSRDQGRPAILLPGMPDFHA